MSRLLATTFAVAVIAGAAQAQTTITCLAFAGHLPSQHEPLAERFNAMQDEIDVVDAAPAKDYADIHLRMLRGSATDTLPDCAFSTYTQLPPLSEVVAARGQIVDLGPLVETAEELMQR